MIHQNENRTIDPLCDEAFRLIEALRDIGPDTKRDHSTLREKVAALQGWGDSLMRRREAHPERARVDRHLQGGGQ